MSKTTNALIALGVVAGLGAAALPLSTYAADGEPKSEQVGVTLTIEDELTLAADKSTTAKVDLTDGSTTDDVTLTVVTNNQKGYNLSIKGSAEKNPTSLTSENGDQIVAGSGRFATPAALDNTTDSQWGYRINALTEKFTDGLYAGVTEEGEVIVNTSAPTGKDGEATVVTFGASLKDGQPAGTYDGEVTFTATNNAITNN